MAETFVYATYIRTTPEKLWEALTNGDFSVKYWMGFRIELELKTGGRVRILPPKGMEQHGDHAGEVLACEPLRKLVYTWNPKDEPGVAKKRESLSRVTYELKPMGDQVRLRLIHENLLPEESTMAGRLSSAASRASWKRARQSFTDRRAVEVIAVPGNPLENLDVLRRPVFAMRAGTVVRGSREPVAAARHAEAN